MGVEAVVLMRRLYIACSVFMHIHIVSQHGYAMRQAEITALLVGLLGECDEQSRGGGILAWYLIGGGGRLDCVCGGF